MTTQTFATRINAIKNHYANSDTLYPISLNLIRPQSYIDSGSSGFLINSSLQLTGIEDKDTGLSTKFPEEAKPILNDFESYNKSSLETLKDSCHEDIEQHQKGNIEVSSFRERILKKNEEIKAEMNKKLDDVALKIIQIGEEHPATQGVLELGYNAVHLFIKNIVNAISDFLVNLVNKIVEWVKEAYQKVKNFFEGAISSVESFFSAL